MCSIGCLCCWWPWDPLTPQTIPISTFCEVFCIFVVGECRDFIFGIGWSYASPSLQTTNRPILNLWDPGPCISQEWLKLKLSNFVLRWGWWAISSITKWMKNHPPKGAWLWSLDLTALASAIPEICMGRGLINLKWVTWRNHFPFGDGFKSLCWDSYEQFVYQIWNIHVDHYKDLKVDEKCKKFGWFGC